MTISIAIATYNEEKNIIRCLKSVYDWVDEMVIVDGTSTDKTVELIKQFDKLAKIRLFIEENPPMFHINKQKALERCRGDWILQLDADEVVSEELKKEIVKLLNYLIAKKRWLNKNNITKQYNNKTIAYQIPRLNFFLGRPLKKGGQYPDYTLRLYRNGVARFPCQSVHEQVTVDPTVILSHPKPSASRRRAEGESKDPHKNKNSLEIGYLKAPLLHYPYPSFSEYINKWNRYTTQEAEILKKQGFKPSVWNFIKYFFILPKLWFFKTYIRHLGFLDGFPGFVFSLFSAIRYWGIYTKTVFFKDSL